MAGHLCCADCGQMVNVLLEDPRNPPMDIGGCLCGMCCESACEEVIDDLEERISMTMKLKDKSQSVQN